MTTVNNHLFIASYDSNEIIAVDAKNMKVIKKVSTGKGPFQILFRKGE